MLKINEQIGYFRKIRKMSQEQLANQLGISNQAVSKWESGLNCPDISLIPALAKVLEVSIADLFGEGNGAPITSEDKNNIRVVVMKGNEIIKYHDLSSQEKDELKEFSFEFIGDCNNIECYGNLKIKGNIYGQINCNNDLSVEGNISSDINANNEVMINGNVEGDVNTGNQITINGNVNGDVNAGDAISISGDVFGNVDAGDEVNIDGDVDGNVDAGDEVNIDGDVFGNIDAGDEVIVHGNLKNEN